MDAWNLLLQWFSKFKKVFKTAFLLSLFFALLVKPDYAFSDAVTSAQVDDEELKKDQMDQRAIEYHQFNLSNQDYYLNLNNPFIEKNNPKYRHLMIQSAYTTIAGIGVMVYLWNQPSSFTNWYDRDHKNFVKNYASNILTIPRLDNDDMMTNYVGHPLAGATYYVMARQNDLPWYESFLYSAVMSTFFWEYGLEALVEVPSIQDLIITPVVGSLIGEAMHELKQTIKRNDNEIFGSRIAGRIGMWILDPLGHFTSGLHYTIFNADSASSPNNSPKQHIDEKANNPASSYLRFEPKLAFSKSF